MNAWPSVTFGKQWSLWWSQSCTRAYFDAHEGGIPHRGQACSAYRKRCILLRYLHAHAHVRAHAHAHTIRECHVHGLYMRPTTADDGCGRSVQMKEQFSGTANSTQTLLDRRHGMLADRSLRGCWHQNSTLSHRQRSQALYWPSAVGPCLHHAVSVSRIHSDACVNMGTTHGAVRLM